MSRYLLNCHKKLMLHSVFFLGCQILSLEKQERPPDHQHSAQVKKPSVSKDARKGSFKPQVPVYPPADLNKPAPGAAGTDTEAKTEVAEKSHPSHPSPQWPTDLSRSSSSLLASSLSYSPSHLSVKEPTPSIASDISLPIATQELRQRLRQLEKYGLKLFLTLICIMVDLEPER